MGAVEEPEAPGIPEPVPDDSYITPWDDFFSPKTGERSSETQDLV